jgi:hypothetical protein
MTSCMTPTHSSTADRASRLSLSDADGGQWGVRAEDERAGPALIASTVGLLSACLLAHPE